MQGKIRSVGGIQAKARAYAVTPAVTGFMFPEDDAEEAEEGVHVMQPSGAELELLPMQSIWHVLDGLLAEERSAMTPGQWCCVT